MRAALSFALLALLLALSTAEGDGQFGDAAGMGAGAVGTLGCKWWRMRSISNSVGQYWQVKEIQFFASTDGSGAAKTMKDVKQMISSTYKDSPKPGKPDTSQFKAAKAMDGDTKTYWSSSSNIKFEFLAVEFKEPQDIRSIKAQLNGATMGPTMVIIEKSFDGKHWARSTEVASMKAWGSKMEVYPLVQMDSLPAVSTFAIRSQEDPRYCLGVRPTKAKDPEDPDIPLQEGALLESQLCADGTTTQYWRLTINGLLANAKDNSYVMKAASGAKGAALSIAQHVCTKAAGSADVCPKWGADSKVNFSDKANGGFFYLTAAGKGNIVVSLVKLAKGKAATLGACGTAGGSRAVEKNCPNEKLSRFELKPMFLTEANKMAIGCAPYTHSLQKPLPATTELIAMAACAKDGNCLAYNWAGKHATCPTTPPCQGKYTAHVWVCTALHEVHSSQLGWSLGVRAGKLEPFVEEERAMF